MFVLVFVLVLVLVLQVSRLLGGVIVHRVRPFLVMVYRVSWLGCALVYGNRPERACVGLAWLRDISVVF